MTKEVKKKTNQNKDIIRPSIPLFLSCLSLAIIMTIFSISEIVTIFINNKDEIADYIGVIIFMILFTCFAITLILLSIKFLCTKLEFNEKGVYYRTIFKHQFINYSEIKEYGFAREKNNYDLYLIRENDDFLVMPLSNKLEVKASYILNKYKDKLEGAIYIDHIVIKQRKK